MIVAVLEGKLKASGDLLHLLIALISEIVVTDRFRNKGVGKKLCKNSMSFKQTNGIP